MLRVNPWYLDLVGMCAMMGMRSGRDVENFVRNLSGEVGPGGEGGIGVKKYGQVLSCRLIGLLPMVDLMWSAWVRKVS